MAKLTYQDLGDLQNVDAASIGKAIIVPTKEALRQVRSALTGNLTIRDNAYAAVMTLGYIGNSTQTLTSGVEYTFQNPLKTAPIGFTPIKCVDANGLALTIDGCELNTARTDGLLGITPQMYSTTGFVGEEIRGFVPFASRITLTNSTSTYNVQSLTVTPGTWDLNSITDIGTAVTGTQSTAAISLTSATMPGASAVADNRAESPTVPSAASGLTLNISQWRQSIAATTTYFHVAQVVFSAGGPPTAFGRLSAVRASLAGNGISGILVGILWGG